MSKLIFGYLCVTALAGAQTILDGNLDDQLWQKASAGKLVPAEAGVPAALGGEIRTAIAGRYVYIGARLPEPTGRFTARSLGRDPNWEEEDLLRVAVGADFLSADWVIHINPLGAYSVEKKGMLVPANETEKLFAAARIDGAEWRAEIAVPLFMLATPPLEAIRVSVDRIRAVRPGAAEQRWRWPEREPSAKISGPTPLVPDEPDPVLRPLPAGNSEPPLNVPRVRELPKGNAWDQAPWRDVVASKLLHNEPAKLAPRFPAEVKLIHDGRTLAVLARCGSGTNPPQPGESFQVLLATSGSAYVRISVDPSASIVAAAGKTGGSYVSRARSWNSQAHASVSREPEAWLVRIDIPLEPAATILGEARAPHDWRLMFVRNSPGGSGAPPESSVFPVTESATALCPARFRRAVLTEAGPPGTPTPAAAQEGGALSSLDTRVFSAAERKQLDLANMLDRHVRSRVRKILEAERRDWDRVNSRADWERFRDPKIKALAASFGEFPQRGPLQTRVTREYRGNGYRRQDLVYLSRPGVWVPANLYLPEKPSGQMPGIVIIHSHHRPRTQADLQDMGILWARLGNAVLIMDQAGTGERIAAYPWNREAYHSRYVIGMQLHLAGDSLAKWIVWDTMRGVDLLLERPDVRRDQIILLGAVAGGGDPAGYMAALDPRIAAVVPFVFGEALPETVRFLPDHNQWPHELADPGWGQWESTRCLRRSIIDQFFPWTICASVAPRRFVYAYELGWKVEEQPAWARYRKVFGLYDALDNVSEVHGYGPFPGPGECTNIGRSQRRSLYPSLERWFKIPPPATEPEDRRPERELAALTPAGAPALGMRAVHEVARDEARAKLDAARNEMGETLSVPGWRQNWVASSRTGLLKRPCTGRRALPLPKCRPSLSRLSRASPSRSYCSARRRRPPERT